MTPPISALALPLDRPRLLRRALLIWALSCLALLAVVVPIVHQHDEAIRAQVVDDLRQSLHHHAFTAERRLLERSANLRVQTRVPVIARFLSERDAPLRAEVARVLASVSDAYAVYDQVRLLDLAGQELVRVDRHDGRAVVLPEAALQDKSDRYYVQAGLSLAPGELYVSRVDLKVERGRIEAPHTPVLRLVTPAVDAQGRKAGLLVFNVLADTLWHPPGSRLLHAIDARPMWADSRGFWFSHPNPAMAFGADLNQPAHNMAVAWPAAWPLMARAQDGELTVPGGRLLFETVRPVHEPSGPDGPGLSNWQRVVMADRQWTVALHLPEAELGRATLMGQPGAWPLSLLVLACLFVPALLLALVIEQRRLAQRIELQSRAELNDLYDNAPCGYHSVDGQGVVLRMNQTELDWLGYRADEVVGRPIADFMSPASQQAAARAFPQFKASGELHELELDFVRRDGSLFPASLAASAVKAPDGRFLYSRTTLFDLREHRQHEQALEQLAFFDALTGLANRRHFLSRAATELARAMRHGEPLSLLALDVDHFKRVNDQHGHATGDEVLRTLGGFLANLGRPGDLAGRLGGEEFAVLLPHTDSEGARVVAERLRERVQATPVAVMPALGGQTCAVTVSVGLASWVAGMPEESLECLMHRADQALYTAKAQGRNRVVTG